MGLGDPLHIDVELQCAHNLEVAWSDPGGAWSNWRQSRSNRCALHRCAPPALMVARPVTPTVGRFIRRLMVPEMEERKRLGLYYNCDEKFS